MLAAGKFRNLSVLSLLAFCLMPSAGNPWAWTIQEVTIRAASRMVLVDLIAYDKKTGARLPQLTQDDLELTDNARTVTITSFDRNPRPITLWFVMICNELDWFDRGSTFFSGKTDILRPALARLKALDRVAVAHWCDDGSSMIDLPPTSNRESALAVIEEVLHRRPTIRPDCAPGTLALQRTIRLIADHTRTTIPRPTPVLVFVHGDAMGMSVSRAEVITEDLLEISAIVYGINNGAFRGERTGVVCRQTLDEGETVQMQLAQYWSGRTGGRVLSTSNEAYGESLGQLLDEAHARYQLGFIPETLDGKWHRLRLGLKQSAKQTYRSVGLRYRSGYKAVPEPDKSVLNGQAVDDAMPLSFALKSDREPGDIAFDVVASSPPDPSVTPEVRLAVAPSPLSWTLLASGDRECVVTVLLAYLAAGDEILDYEIRDLKARRSKLQWEKTPEYPVILTLNAALPSQADRIRIVVRDTQSGRMGRRDLHRAHTP